MNVVCSNETLFYLIFLKGQQTDLANGLYFATTTLNHIQHLVSSIFFILVMSVDIILLCTSLMTNDVEHEIMCFLSIHTSSFIKCQFKFVFHFYCVVYIFITGNRQVLSQMYISEYFLSLSLGCLFSQWQLFTSKQMFYFSKSLNYYLSFKNILMKSLLPYDCEDILQ